MMSKDTQTDEPKYIDLTPKVRISSDYRRCLHHGREFTFKEMESYVVNALVDQYRETGFTTMTNEEIEEYAFPPNMRGMKTPRDLFRRNRRRNGSKELMNPAWNVVIGPGEVRGELRLILDPPSDCVT